MTTQAPPSSERRIEQDLMVTGEAVALEVVPATVVSRLLSGVIDYGIYGIGLWATAMSLAMLAEQGALGAGRPDGAQLAVLISLIVFLWMVAIPLAVELLSNGRSAGRLVMGTRVVRDDGGAVRWRHSLVRVLIGVVEIWLSQALLALGTSLVTKRGKRLGDLLAGTYVVRERHDMRDGAPLLMPPELSSWAAGTDIRRIPGGLSLAVRTFLHRAGTMRPEHRHRLGLDLAQQMQGLVSPPPPSGTHPERFLAAVMVERRNRELILELRDRALEDVARQEMERPVLGVGTGTGAGGAQRL